ncbi:ash family protein [Klebsiella pneumoniae]|uniref:ash family protein n=1 Tax=Klebsiella pneumoniae TaxID=573 RepID=UPI002E8248F1|nr:ash family protein [Klebsiella pneumoniae]MEE2289493.1 ash family protein [Klebsiella pneumoniae]
MCHSDRASAKSGAGIGTPDDYKGALTAQAVFFMRSARPHSNYGGACRGTERCAGSFVAGSSNPVRLTTSEIGTSGGD